MTSERDNANIRRDNVWDANFDGVAGNNFRPKTMTRGVLNLSPRQPGKTVKRVCKGRLFLLVAFIQGVAVLEMNQGEYRLLLVG
ncbi:MAG: hypothetical protein HQL63_06580 [Magnetococcales bacterium]|nr:hypothetical protein [Magnetococcales bacterium]MBF0321830.1 hypothetical protein [Magnetococcales bacterium]